jgi:hypothetical protein
LFDNSTELEDIAYLLGGLPLALSQVSGFMITSRFACKHLIELLKQPENLKTLRDLPYAGSTSGYRQTIANVWQISISALDPAALEILEVMTFFDHNGK